MNITRNNMDRLTKYVISSLEKRLDGNFFGVTNTVITTQYQRQFKSRCLIVRIPGYMTIGIFDFI